MLSLENERLIEYLDKVMRRIEAAIKDTEISYDEAAQLKARRYNILTEYGFKEI